MTEDPEIAVVVGAYRRERYLLDAVRSVLAQDLLRDRYEVVVVKDFANETVDRFLREHGVPALLNDEPRTGAWLLNAVHATRAPILAFLDDDDEFEPGRLAHVLATFRDHPEVGFYRNRVRVMDERGLAVSVERWRTVETDAEFDATGPVLVRPDRKADLFDIAVARSFSTFNLSTMAARRDVLSGAFAERFAQAQLPDLALFVLAAVGPWGFYLDDQRLTRYRVFSGNVTGQVNWLKHASEAHRDLGAFAKERGRAEFAVWLDRQADHYERLYHGGRVVESVASNATRRAVASLATQYVRFLGGHPKERALTLDVLGAALYGLGYLVAPSMARTVLAARPTARAA